MAPSNTDASSSAHAMPTTPTPTGTVRKASQALESPLSSVPNSAEPLVLPFDPFARPPSPSQAPRAHRPRKVQRTSENTPSVSGSVARSVAPSSAYDDESSDGEFMTISDDGASEPDFRLEFDEESEQDDKVADPDFTGEEPTQRKPNKGKGKDKDKALALQSPGRRVPLGASITTDAKRRATAADPNHGLCLLTGSDQPTISRQWAHVLARATKPGELTNLEWSCGMRYFSLYIDSKWNLMPLRSDWHLPFDANLWALVPHHRLIKEVMDWVDSRSTIPKRTPISKLWGPKTVKSAAQIRIHTYFMLPLSDSLRKVSLYRLSGEFDPVVGEARHVYPFKTVGRLSSHVQPHFVIYTAGQKLAEIEKSLPDAAAYRVWLQNLSKVASFGHRGEAQAEKNLKSLQDIMGIYRAWATPSDLPNTLDTWYVLPKK
ncbi:hypothetical protein DFH06DRAFT_6452 [Mycena polygramma]|nr:hypothetical protein DFH06DRAFT_6452 [Mycena polygramma]